MLTRILPSLSTLVLCLVIAAPPASTALAGGAEGFIRSMGDRAVATVNARDLNDAQRAKRFGEIFRQAFDVPVIARFVLGQYWRRASEKERKEYLDLFADYVVHTYSERFKGYEGISFRVGQAKPVGKQEQLVPSEVVRPNGQPPIGVQWRVRTANGYKIVDVIAEGVSMLISQREEFGSIISRAGGKVSALNAELRRRTQGGGQG